MLGSPNLSVHHWNIFKSTRDVLPQVQKQFSALIFRRPQTLKNAQKQTQGQNEPYASTPNNKLRSTLLMPDQEPFLSR